MPSITYDQIYKRALTRINDLELAKYTQDDFYESMKEWLHSAYSSIIFRSKFSSFKLDDEIMQITFTLTNSVDDGYDTDFVTTILAKGVIINYFPSKLEESMNLHSYIGGKEEKISRQNYNQNMERLKNLQHEYERELTRHSYHFGSYGES
jgi:competence CoiA-like predicted nuclease